MRTLLDPRRTNIFFDAMVLDRNKHDQAEESAVDALLNDPELICVLPHSVKAELRNAPAPGQQRSQELIFTEPVELTPEEQAGFRRMLQLVQGAGSQSS